MIKKLKDFMVRKNINQDRLAALLGTNKFTLSRWMNGQNTPSPAYQSIIESVLKNYK